MIDLSSHNDDIICLQECHYANPYAGYHEEPFNNVYNGLKRYHDSRGVANFIW